MSNNAANFLNKFMTEGIIIAAVPFIGYILGYAYELGFTHYYNLPEYFIKVDLNFVLICVATLLAIMAVGTRYIVIYIAFYDYIQRSKYKLVFDFAIIISGFYLFIKRQELMSIQYILLAFLCLLNFIILPFLWERYGDKSSKNEPYKQTVLGIIFWISVFLVFIFYSGGYLNAQKSCYFLITSTEPEMVVIRIYEDDAVCALFDRKTKTIGNQFKVIKINDGEIVFSVETIKGIHPAGFTKTIRQKAR